MLQNFIAARAIAPTPQTRNLTCNQCSGKLLKYVEFFEYPDQPLIFTIAQNQLPTSSSGVIQVHTWSATPNSSPPPAGRIWVANVNPGGTFRFQPTASRKFLSLYKRNGSNRFDAICFDYIDETRTFVIQTF